MTRQIGTRALFMPGPTNVPEVVRRAIDIPMEDHRAPDLPDLMLPLFADLKSIFMTETGQVIVFPGSGTGGWEAALTNTLNPGDTVLIARFGQFSHLWVDMAERLGFGVQVVETEWGEGIPLARMEEALRADKRHQIKAVLATQNETATGVASDIAGLRKVMDAVGHPAMLMVDGVSSIASVEFRMDEWGVDVAVSGSQKGFMLPAGLAIVAFSARAMDAAQSNACRRCYFDIRDMIKTNAQGYFPYTPPMSLIRGLRVAVDLLLDEGLENVWHRHNRLAGAVRAAVDGWGLSLCARRPEVYSDTVSAIMLPEGHDGAAFIKHAYHTYGISYGAGLTKVAGKLFRIGHLGDLNETMVLSVLGATELVMRDMGVAHQPGQGVAMAVEHLHQTRPNVARIAAE